MESAAVADIHELSGLRPLLFFFLPLSLHNCGSLPLLAKCGPCHEHDDGPEDRGTRHHGDPTPPRGLLCPKGALQFYEAPARHCLDGVFEWDAVGTFSEDLSRDVGAK